MQTDIEGSCIGIKALAEKLGLSSRTVWRFIERGEFPTLQIGRRRLIPLSDVRHWLTGYEVKTPAASVTIASRQFIDRAAIR
jgi:excisionase family DNA binding protein